MTSTDAVAPRAVEEPGGGPGTGNGHAPVPGDTPTAQPPAPAADHGRTPRRTLLAAGLFGLVLAEVATAALGAVVAGFTYVDARDSFLLTNSAIALSFGVAAVLIAVHRPRNPIGWLLLAAAAMQGSTAAAAPLLVIGTTRGWPEPLLRTVQTVAVYGWPWSIGLLVPLALLVFPTGALPGPRWRPVVWFTAVNSIVFVVANGASPQGLLDDPDARAWFLLADHERWRPLWTAVEITNLAVYLAALAGLVLRYRRGDEQQRRQLLWLVLAVTVVLGMLVFWGPNAAGPAGQLVLVLLVIPLVPAAITIAVLRHRLLDIRLVFSRAVLYALLTAGVVGAYLGLVAAADLVVRSGPGPSLLATLVVAAAFNPVRVRLQRVVDRALYGDRADPVRVLARMGSGVGDDPDGLLTTLRDGLRLPYVALRVGDSHRGVGDPPELLATVPLRHRAEQVGELVVGMRAGQRRLDPADRAALEVLAGPLGVAVHATALGEAVQRSREEIVAAREEERRRLRRDLHDGLGPVLTGIAFRADAAGNLLRGDPDAAARLLAELRADATGAIADVRRLVYALRPPALDEVGLVEALRRQSEQLGAAGSGVSVVVTVPRPLPELPAAVEVAAYRIGMEALTNAVRHAGARHVELTVVVDGALEIVVRDDGAGGVREWRPGVGLSSIGERATELGGTWSAGPVAGGGLVRACLPIGAGDG
ncbi:MAG TPA: histidine kinase [Pseudonocardia sp.]|nr:histidine kinase [Pseudonocardia sp.]